MDRTVAPITILSSGIGLGVYIPALLIQQQLRRNQYHAELEVLEEYYTPTQQTAHLAYRDACHQNFALAQIAHRMAKDVTESLDEARIAALLRVWAEERRNCFIVWSGFWLPTIERYRELIGNKPLYVDHCRIDADISASFKIHNNIGQDATEIWLWNGRQQEIVNEIVVTDDASVPFNLRQNRLVIHGGGWGLGTYQSKVVELSETQYALDIVVHNPEEVGCKRDKDRFYRVDSAWQPWLRGEEGEHEFPPVGEMVESGSFQYRTNSEYHEFYKIISHSKAIVSKPGGCTLIDSLSSATPIVLLEPYGYAEKCNAKLWKQLGFGISYSDWQATGYDHTIIEKLHKNILERDRKAPDYVKEYVQRIHLKGML